MKLNAQRATICVFLFFVALIGVAAKTPLQDHPAPYPSMAPLDQYLITDPNAEAALARSAAPEAISRDAKVMVLGPHGYQTVAEGKNGFACIVERGWMAPFDNPEFWNPKIRGPLCFNPQATRSILPITVLRTGFVLDGLSKDQIIAKTKIALGKNELPALESGAMCYMMAKGAYLTDQDDHNMAHLMFYTPLIGGAAWGADLTNSPVLLNTQFNGNPEPINVFMVPTGRWSDGTSAPVM